MIVSSGGKMTPTAPQMLGIGSGLTGACIVALSSQASDEPTSSDVSPEKPKGKKPPFKSKKEKLN
jgi:hypothetical protein